MVHLMEEAVSFIHSLDDLVATIEAKHSTSPLDEAMLAYLKAAERVWSGSVEEAVTLGKSATDNLRSFLVNDDASRVGIPADLDG